MANFYGQFIGFGAGGEAAAVFHGNGVTYGYVCGGSLGSAITRYAFASSANGVDTTKDLVASEGEVGSVSSSTHGYVLGGEASDRIEKFNMVTVADSVDIANLTYPDAHRCAGCMSPTYGFASGGTEPTGIVTINRFPFASDSDAEDWGDLTVVNHQASGHSSVTHGHTSGSGNNSDTTDVIDRFPFASSSGAVDWGDLTEPAGYNAGGQQSETYGYRSGGRVGMPNVSSDVIDKFPFASSAGAADVGNMTVGRRMQSDGSFTTHGYSAGGYKYNELTNVIDRHSFTSDGDAVDVGDLTAICAYMSGHQV